mmetsp:Transcript_28628/g.67545  ORF Transcript_28628/g.67545 Transcript_28628/m.67545 type:complete len:244 (-) Transcript_28628:209-940(-)
MLSIIPSTMSYQAPLVARSVSTVQMSAITPGDIGTTKPLGVYDPLQLMTKNPEKYRRFQEMEIKHGRMSMAACAHVFVVGAGFKFPGYISYLSFPPLKFEDIPASPVASWETLPQAGWAQIVCLIAIIDNSLFAQDPNLAPGDVVGDKIPWVRYSDPAVKEFKLNAERNNGRAAMMGISGMVIHEALTGNPVWPIPVPPQPVLEIIGDDVEKGPARVGAFVLASLGMAFAGIVAAIPELSQDE